jgi:hypothetical protein
MSILIYDVTVIHDNIVKNPMNSLVNCYMQLAQAIIKPKTSGANPVSAKPVEGEQASQVMRDERSDLDFIMREK